MGKKSVLSFILLFSILSFAQAQEIIYGRYTQKEIDLKEVAYEPEADAVILGENSTSKIEIPEMESVVTRRLKILKPSGIKYGTVTIPFYHGAEGWVRVTKVKAQITNFKDGEQKTIALKDSDFFTVDTRNGWKEIRFTLPDVQEGSIIEYEYIKLDKRLTVLEGWVFQNPLPTLLSVYSIEIPGTLNYRVLSQGEQATKHRFDARKDGTYKWILTDLRSFSEEPYMSHYMDYLEKIEFQLAGYGFRSSTNVFSTWVDLARFLMNVEDMRSYAKPNKANAEKIQEKIIERETQLETAKVFYKHVVDNFEYNGYSGIVADEPIKRLFETKKGARPDINMLLLAYLTQNGIEAYPVLISSKGNGRSNIVDSPFADQFNQLILAVIADGKVYYVDATSKQVPFGYLPEAFHVEKGFLLKDKESGLIPISITHRSGIQQAVNIKLENTGNLISESSIRFLEYDAIALDTQLAKSTEEEVKKESFQLDGETILDFSLSSREEPRKAMDAKLKKSFGEFGGDLLFIQPFQYNRWSENPFKAESRTFPVDFYHTFLDNYTSIIEIPEGYELDDYPEEASLMLPSGLFAFNYKISSLDGMVKVNATLDLKANVLPAALYGDLKYFMEVVTSKLKEPVVLKKISQP